MGYIGATEDEAACRAARSGDTRLHSDSGSKALEMLAAAAIGMRAIGRYTPRLAHGQPPNREHPNVHY